MGLHFVTQHQQGTAESHQCSEGVHRVIIFPITLFVCANTSHLSFQRVLFKFWITTLEGKDILQPFHDCDLPRGECDLKSPFSILGESIVFTVFAKAFFPWSSGSF